MPREPEVRKRRNPAVIQQGGGLLDDPPKPLTSHKYAGIREWQAEHAISRLLRTSIRLQNASIAASSSSG